MAVFIVCTDAAIALLLFRAAAVSGSNLLHLGRRAALMALIGTALAALFLSGGYALGHLLLGSAREHYLYAIHTNWLVFLILLLTSLRILMMGLHEKGGLEHRLEHISYGQETASLLHLQAVTFEAGFSCGILAAPFPVLCTAVALTALSAIAAGYVTGQAQGPVFTRSICTGSAACLFAASLCSLII